MRNSVIDYHRVRKDARMVFSHDGAGMACDCRSRMTVMVSFHCSGFEQRVEECAFLDPS